MTHERETRECAWDGETGRQSIHRFLKTNQQTGIRLLLQQDTKRKKENTRKPKLRARHWVASPFIPFPIGSPPVVAVPLASPPDDPHRPPAPAAAPAPAVVGLTPPPMIGPRAVDGIDSCVCGWSIAAHTAHATLHPCAPRPRNSRIEVRARKARNRDWGRSEGGCLS